MREYAISGSTRDIALHDVSVSNDGVAPRRTNRVGTISTHVVSATWHERVSVPRAVHACRGSNDVAATTPWYKHSRNNCPRVSAPRAVHACLRPESGFLGTKTCHIFENVSRFRYRLVIVAVRNRSLTVS